MEREIIELKEKALYCKKCGRKVSNKIGGK